MRILVASGTRADWGLLRPLCDELRRRGHLVEVALTNMHSSPLFGGSGREVEADGYEPVASVAYHEGRSATVAANVEGFSGIFRERRPDCIVILGDRIEMLGVASAALVEGVPIVHVAGGTVSEGAVDDSIRHAISKMAALHLTETERTAERLLAMGEEPRRVVVTGAVGVYNALNVPLMPRVELEESLGWHLPEEFVVGTLHAATLDDVPPVERMRAFLKALEEWMLEDEKRGALLTYPNSDSDPRPLIEELRALESRRPERVKVVASLGMRRYLSAVSLSAGVVGNSSSGLVEVPSLGVPTLDIGLRQQGRECGPSVWHCGDSVSEILDGLRHVSLPWFRRLAARRENPYFLAATPVVMADAVERGFAKGLLTPFPSKRFHEHNPMTL